MPERPCRVLVVDDEQPIAEAISRSLEAEGYEVQVVHDGKQALDCCVSFRPDAIVLDVMMPRLNGYRVSRIIKTMGPVLWQKQVPRIVLVTGRRLDHDPQREQMFREFSRADALLYKPFRFQELSQTLRQVLAAPAGRSPSAV